MTLPNYFFSSLQRYKSVESSIEQTKEGIKDRKSPIELETNKKNLESRMYRLGSMPGISRERLIGNNDIVHMNIIDRIRKVANTVGRISIADEAGTAQGYGTGFLVGPGMLLTNHHVIPDRLSAANAFVDFNFELLENTVIDKYYRFKLKGDGLFITSSDEGGLDYTLLEVETHSFDGKTSLEIFGWNRLYPEPGKAVKGEAMIVIQHPGGDVKKVAFRNNNLLYHFDDFLQYDTDTMPGSSGGLVANIGVEIVALHHSSVPCTDKGGNVLTKDGDVYDPNKHTEKDIDWIANEGVRISSICKDVFGRTNLSEKEKQILEKVKGRPYYPGTEINKTPASNSQSDKQTKLTTDKIPAVKTNNTGARRKYLVTIKSGRVGVAALRQIEKTYSTKISSILFGESFLHPAMELCYQCDIETPGSPWLLAQQLVNIPGVEEAVPDLPHATHIDDGDALLQNGNTPKGSPGALKKKENFLNLAKENFSRNDAGNESFKNQLGGKWNEEDKFNEYKKRFGEYKNIDLKRDWNHTSSGFSEAIKIFNKKHPHIVSPASLRVKIAQLDTGYALHPEIADLQTSLGRDFVDDDDNATDELVTGLLRQPMHGTRTSSIIVGRKTNLSHEGNNGVFPYAPVVPFRVSNSVILISRFTQVANAIKYAIENGFQVLSMSMGVLPGHRQWKALVKYAYDSGLIWVNAAGNQVKFVVAPAKYPGTIAVAASNVADQTWTGSCRGSEVDITAPGEDIYVPIWNDNEEHDYSYGSGTSYATPHVAAAAAMWLEYHSDVLPDKYKLPWQRIEAFRWCLVNSARKPQDLEKLNGDFVTQNWNNNSYGSGILDAVALLNIGLPDSTLLKNAYTISGMEMLENRELSIEEMEIVYNELNKTYIDSLPGTKESLSGFSLTPRAEELKNELILANGGSSNESTINIVAEILQ